MASFFVTLPAPGDLARRSRSDVREPTACLRPDPRRYSEVYRARHVNVNYFFLPPCTSPIDLFRPISNRTTPERLNVAIDPVCIFLVSLQTASSLSLPPREFAAINRSRRLIGLRLHRS